MSNNGVSIDGTVRVPLDNQGAVSFELAATTDPQTFPAGVTYDIFVYLNGSLAHKYTTPIPSTVSQLDITQDLPWGGSVGGLVHPITPTSLSGGWTPMPGNPGPYYLQGDEGVLHFGGSITGGNAGVPAFTLPAGLRPALNNVVLPALCFDGSIGTLIFATNGTVTPQTSASYRLDGLSFIPAGGSQAYPTTNATLEGAWTAEAGYPAPYYVQGPDDVVHLGGAVTGGAAGSVAWNMPLGMRPVTSDICLLAQSFDGSLGNLVVKPNGDVIPQTSASYHLDGLSYIPGV
jgi:hypothetical protein